MNSISFLISYPADLTVDSIGLQTLLRSLGVFKPDYNFEIIIYNTPIATIQYSPFSVRYISKSGKLPSIQRAIVAAGGNIVAFTEYSTFLKDANNIVEEIQSHNSSTSTLPLRNTRSISYRLGMRSAYRVPYFACKKSYLVANLPHTSSLHMLIRKCDEDLSLCIIESRVPIGDSVVPDFMFIRPYGKIMKARYREKMAQIKQKKLQRQADSLRAQVARVPYSHNIPVFIICRDRVEPLKKLVNWLEDEGLRNIYFVDNASTYPPLLDYFSTTPYEVVRLNTNAGHTSPWTEGIVQLYAQSKPFIVTDPDVIPAKSAHGAVRLFARLLNEHPERTKTGFGLRIDNLPDHYDLKEHVIAWEKQFWVSLVEPDVYDAEIDTTFALYRPHTPYTHGPGLRTGGKFVAEHEPWYINSKHIPDEVKYYREHADKVVGSWGADLHDMNSTYANKFLHDNIQSE